MNRTQFFGLTSFVVAVASGVLVPSRIAGAQPVYSILHTFSGQPTDGSLPYTGLVQGSDGNFYGTTSAGGANNLGTAFKMTSSGAVTILHSFDGTSTDGGFPSALIQAADGNFYGTGAYGGTVFKMTSVGIVTVLHSLDDTGVSREGYSPSGLIQAADGNLYGTTRYGGAHGGGTVFRVTPSGTFTVLHSFDGRAMPGDGFTPDGALIQAADGNFYGSTREGGASGAGTVFKMTSAGIVTILYSFSDWRVEGGNRSGIIQASDGNFYGTAEVGGAYGVGTVFRITPSGVFTVAYTFTATGVSTDGSRPVAPLLQASDGNLYGTSYAGGAGDLGTIFQMTLSGSVTILHSFVEGGPTDGAYPVAPLIQASDGYLYGTTKQGGLAITSGTVFRQALPPSVMTSVSLTSDKSSPQPPGTPITFTAAGKGGVIAYAYKFLLTTNDWATYTVVQDWSLSATFTWTPATASVNYQVGVGARSVWDTADAWEVAAAVSFPITAAALTVSVTGSGGVFTDDGFITCPSITCSHIYAAGTAVTLQPVPVVGFVFAGWSSSACSSGVALLLTDQTCGATFLPVAVGAPRKGTVNISGAGLGDVFTYSATTGAYTEQLSDGLGHFGEIRGTWPAGLQVYPADFNNDGRTDFLVYSPISGAWSKAINDGAGGFTYTGGAWPTGLQMYLMDLNGDSQTDLFAYNPTTGLWSRCVSTGTGTGGFSCTSGTWPTGVTLYPADFNADGLADLFAYNASTGAWSLAVNTGTGFTYSNGMWPTGLTLLPGDFNGDGRSDFFVSNPATGAWSVATTQANLTFTYVSGTWSAGWTFVPGDFNGDGKTDLFLFQPAQGWWNEAISNGLASVFTLTPGAWSAGWQLQVTDLNGDGQSDALLYSPTSGVWYQALHTGAGTFTYTTGTWSPGLTIIGSLPKIP